MCPTSSSSDSLLGERLLAVQERIDEACREAGRAPAEVQTIVVTKTHPASLIEQLLDLGVRRFGENRHQEARVKAAELAGRELEWHYIGQLQSKKARQVAEYADVVHSIDRQALVEALGARQRPLDCFVQLNLSGDPGRGGVGDSELEALVESVLAAGGLRLLGVMGVAPLGEDPRAAFARLYAAAERVRSLAPEATAISAGMSHDFVEAIAEGATHLRIGSAITGERAPLG